MRLGGESRSPIETANTSNILHTIKTWIQETVCPNTNEVN